MNQACAKLHGPLDCVGPVVLTTAQAPATTLQRICQKEADAHLLQNANEKGPRCHIFLLRSQGPGMTGGFFRPNVVLICADNSRKVQGGPGSLWLPPVSKR